MADKEKTDNRVIAFTLLFALAIVVAFYLSGPENNYWLAPGAVMYLILLLALTIPNWWFLGNDKSLSKNMGVALSIFVVPSIVLGIAGIQTSTNVYNYWRSIVLPLYIGYVLQQRGYPGYGILFTFSTPLALMVAMSLSINPLPEVKITGASPNNNA